MSSVKIDIDAIGPPPPSDESACGGRQETIVLEPPPRAISSGKVGELRHLSACLSTSPRARHPFFDMTETRGDGAGLP